MDTTVNFTTPKQKVGCGSFTSKLSVPESESVLTTGFRSFKCKT